MNKELLTRAKKFVETYKTEQDLKTFNQLLDDWDPIAKASAKGLLNCTPTLSEDTHSIVYGWDKYLTKSNGQYVFATCEDGTGVYVVPTIHLYELRSDKAEQNRTVEAMGLLTTAYTYFDKTYSGLDTKVFDEYLSRYGATVDDIMQHVSMVSVIDMPVVSDNALMLLEPSSKDGIALLQFKDTSVEVITKRGDVNSLSSYYVTTKLLLPEWYFMSSVKSKLLVAFTEFLLHSLAIKTNYNLMYQVKVKSFTTLPFIYNVRNQATAWNDVIAYIESLPGKVDTDVLLNTYIDLEVEATELLRKCTHKYMARNILDTIDKSTYACDKVFIEMVNDYIDCARVEDVYKVLYIIKCLKVITQRELFYRSTELLSYETKEADEHNIAVSQYWVDDLDEAVDLHLDNAINGIMRCINPDIEPQQELALLAMSEYHGAWLTELANTSNREIKIALTRRLIVFYEEGLL